LIESGLHAAHRDTTHHGRYAAASLTCGFGTLLCSGRRKASGRNTADALGLVTKIEEAAAIIRTAHVLGPT
jgi:hypothetical protein